MLCLHKGKRSAHREPLLFSLNSHPSRLSIMLSSSACFASMAPKLRLRVTLAPRDVSADREVTHLAETETTSVETSRWCAIC